MNEELELFCEDADEQLTLMEAALVTMQESGVNDDDIGALFRAMHTIKGTAGMFGFDGIVSFAHTAESLLSEIRDGQVELSIEMIDTFFQSKDHMQKLIDLAIDNEELDELTQAVNDDLLNVLKSMMPGVNKTKKIEEELQETIKEDVSLDVLWHISFYLKANFFSSGMDVINILSFFKMLGSINKKLIITSDIPDLKSINPTQAYVGYEMLFLTDISYEEILEIFEFVTDDIELHVFKADNLNLLQTLIDSHDSLLEKLVSAGFENAITLNTASKQIDEKIVNPKIATNIQKTVTKESKKSFSLRVDSNKIDLIINKISELVIANAKVTQRAEILDDNELNESTIVLSDMLEEIRSSVMNIRMIQVGDSFAKYKRIVADIAKKIDKNVNFVIKGGETELDKMVVEKISDPIMHMLRNSVDHGIESAEDRIKNSKPAIGNVTLSAYPDAGTIVIEITDDGKGLDKEKILEKAIVKGIVDKDSDLSDKEIYDLIFSAGITTTDTISDISGRGVGMDVVKRNITDLKGTVDIKSEVGKGSVFTIRLPLTLAIIDGFLIQSGQTKYIIPLDMIQECVELSKSYKQQMQGNTFINLRDSILPLLNIREYLKEDTTQSERENIVVVRYGDNKMGLQVDELHGEFQTVIKPLGEMFVNIPGISGGTILGNGEIALIFDIPKLMEHRLKKSK